MSWLEFVVVLLIIAVIAAIAGLWLARKSPKVIAGITALLALVIWLLHTSYLIPGR
jgi:hypothetical protein